MEKLLKCPLCGCAGDDLIFAFYCSNPKCKNFPKFSKDKDQTKDERTFKWPYFYKKTSE